MFAGIELGHLIEDFRIVFQRLEAVRESFGNVEHSVIRRRQFRREMLAERRRRPPEIDNDVRDRARGTANQLCLRERGDLEMHAAKSALALVERNIALHDARVEPFGFKLSLAKGARKEATFVFNLLRFNHERALQPSFRENQASPAAHSTLA